MHGRENFSINIALFGLHERKFSKPNNCRTGFLKTHYIKWDQIYWDKISKPYGESPVTKCTPDFWPVKYSIIHLKMGNSNMKSDFGSQLQMCQNRDCL